ncbi:MAG: NAD(P)-dependent oxidoreductase [Bacillota bacterium]|nr:NAD(P)-dependent oxidoreductase [Bacillota bacterium]
MSDKAYTIKPIALNTNKLKVLIVGNGLIGTRKKVNYESSFAKVTTVDPDIERGADYVMCFSDFYERYKKIFMEHHLVIISTDNSSVNQQITEICETCHKLYNRTDDGSEGLFSDMCLITHDDYVVAASGKNRSPYVARHIISELKPVLNEMETEIKKISIQTNEAKKMHMPYETLIESLRKE